MDPSQQVSISVLGPLHVQVRGTDVAAGSPRRQAVLGYLAVNAGAAVSRDELIDAVWGEAPPASVVGNLHTYLSELRQLMGTDARGPAGDALLRTLGSAYRLDAADTEIDVRMFEREVRAAAEFARAAATDDAIRSWQCALARWRGTPFAGIAAPYVHSERIRLGSLRLAAMTDLVHALLTRSTEQDTLAALTTIENALEEYPLHQRFAEQRIRILNDLGRRAEAMTHFEATRELLADELGIDPDNGLKAAYEAVANAARTTRTPAPSHDNTRPAHETTRLPPPPPTVLGRKSELVTLERLAFDVARGTPSIIAIDGPPGIGKTALAVRFAHQMAARFPGGCHYVDMRGTRRSSAPVAADDALRELIFAIGEPSSPGQRQVNDQLSRYRSLVAHKRILLVLDDARHVDQVRPLLGSGEGSVVLVTSRYRLPGLGARDGAARLSLNLLAHDDAADLLATWYENGSRERHVPAVAELAHLCGHLPLALRHVGEHLAGSDTLRPDALATWLRDKRRRVSRLGKLNHRDKRRSVENVFETAFHSLGTDEAALFVLFGTQDRTTMTVTDAAVLARWPVRRARHTLERMAFASVLDWAERDSYRITPLLHAYATSLRKHSTHTAEPAEVRRAS